MYGRKDVVKGWGYCDHCGKYGKNTSYTGRKWGHIYYIPLIPEGSRVRVVKECGKCSHGIHIPEKNVPNILNDLRQSTENALTALISGKKEFNDNGTAAPCAASLANAAELLYCLHAEDHLRSILATLQEKGLEYPYNLVNGEALEFQGKLDEAVASYQRAADREPTDPLPLMSLGAVFLKKKDYQSARPVYEKALELAEDKFTVLEVLITVYDSLNDYAMLAETYEKCFDLVPELTQDKKVVKAYKKACKKAGKPPMVPYTI